MTQPPSAQRKLGPWADMETPSSDAGQRWWLLRDEYDGIVSAGDALSEILRHDDSRDYFGVTYTVELCCVRFLPEDQQDEEHEIEECRYSSDEGALEAWRVTVRE